ncbi:MAG: glycosyltransferase family 2 protein [Acidimicrobiales bacterium]
MTTLQTRPEVRPPGSGRPRVSVLITSYNYARFLPTAVDSVLNQSGVDVDVLVIDDASTDETPEVSEHLTRDTRVRVLRHEQNRGHIPSVNEGLDALEGDYVVKLDADDLLAPGALARATDLLEARPEVGFVSGRPMHFTATPPRRPAAAARSWTIWPGTDWLAQRCASGYNTISQPEVTMRASVLRAAGPRPESLPHTSDLALWLQMAVLADVGRVNGPPQGYYRVHADSMQRTAHTGHLFDLQARRDAFEYTFAWARTSGAPTLPHAEALLATARRALAAQALDRACRAYERGRTGEVEVDDLRQFALDVWPSAPELPQWRALARRRAVGAAQAPRVPAFVARALLRRSAETIGEWRWQRTGVR